MYILGTAEYNKDSSTVSSDNSHVSEMTSVVLNRNELLVGQLKKYNTLVKISNQNYEDENACIEELYSNEEIFYFFLFVVVKHVIGKMKWKRMKTEENYYDFITPSDEAFALLIIDNCADRFESMITLGPNVSRNQWKATKYTPSGGEGSVGGGRCWKQEGISKYYAMMDLIHTWRKSNVIRLKELSHFVIGKYKTTVYDGTMLNIIDCNVHNQEKKRKELKRKNGDQMLKWVNKLNKEMKYG